ncbi:MAG: HAD-IA family hydrolase [Cyanobacteriota bacterium]
MSRRPEGLLLDAMGTLIGLRRSVGSSYAALAAEYGLEADAAAIDRAFPRVYRQAPPLAFPGLSGTALHAAEIHWWGARIREVLQMALPDPQQQLAGGLPAGLAEALFERFADPALWRLYPEVPDCLRRWRQRGLRLAVVSNFDSRLEGLLAGLGVAEHLETVVVSSAAGAAKPDPAPYRLALAALGLPPEAVWHVGDSPEDDAGARAAGIRCLLVERA